MGAGPLPVDEHRRRPPIPIVPVDDAARAAAIAAGADEGRAWVAAITGDPDALQPRTLSVNAREVDVLRGPLAAHRDTPGMSVGEVALAVDMGREIATRAATDGFQAVVTAAPHGRDDAAARAVAAAFADGSEHGPLGILRRLGDATTAVLCGVALGAGEHGLGCACDGLAALAGAAVAVGIEPDLRLRLAAVRDAGDRDFDALASHLGVVVIRPRQEALGRR